MLSTRIFSEFHLFIKMCLCAHLSIVVGYKKESTERNKEATNILPKLVARMGRSSYARTLSVDSDGVN